MVSLYLALLSSKGQNQDEIRPFHQILFCAIQRYNIDESDLFIYSICHAYDHYCQSGFGIRFICDIYLLLNKLENLDMAYVNSTLENFGIKQFGEDTINLAMAIFEEKEISESEQSLLDFILSGGVYGKRAAF